MLSKRVASEICWNSLVADCEYSTGLFIFPVTDYPPHQAQHGFAVIGEILALDSTRNIDRMFRLRIRP